MKNRNRVFAAGALACIFTFHVVFLENQSGVGADGGLDR